MALRKLKSRRKAPGLPGRQQGDDEGEEPGRAIPNLSGQGVDEGEERPAPDREKVFGMAP
ncbi:MAG: hypothetical protein ACKOB4_03555 [Acidobacteriota bacterium]